jgi:hypothetical protein
MENLEELLLRVRSAAAREDMREAIGCYNVGSYRAAIVATWTAVVYDITAKLRELELAGDKNAATKITKFEAIHARNDLKGSQDWERDVLLVARDEFELLTHQEFEDLERLRVDRHRCAHPAMNTADDPYRPPAELVRYHLRSALVHLLTQAPVQGKAALARLAAEVKSPLFPADSDRALKVFKAGALSRPKDALLRAFVVGTVKESLVGPDRGNADYQKRLLAALNAVSRLHPDRVKRIYAERLPDILRSVADSNVPLIIRLGATVDEVWANLPTDVLIRLEQFVETADPAKTPRTILRAVKRSELHDVAAKRISSFNREQLVVLVKADAVASSQSADVVERSVQLLENSRSWDNSNFVMEWLLEPVAPGVTLDQFARIAQASVVDVDVREAWRTPTLLRAIRDAGRIPMQEFREIADETGLSSEFPQLLGSDADKVNEGGSGEVIEEGEDGHLDRPWAWSVHDPDAEVDRMEEVLPGVRCIPGERVLHARYGTGTVQDRDGTYRDPALWIEFDSPQAGRRRLLVHKTKLSSVQG